MFTYVNPRRHDLFATSFARQIAMIEKGLLKVVRHGNLDSIRTLIDVRDAMDCYWQVAQLGISGETYNLGGTFTSSVGEILELLIDRAKVPITKSLDKKLLRPADVTLQIPDCTKFQSLIDWRPKYSLQESLDFLLDHARNDIAGISEL
jgi:GDPmannose 4,6-dehydratase/GDP-4-dehydro-6-deoxy-D-mannose reductase